MENPPPDPHPTSDVETQVSWEHHPTMLEASFNQEELSHSTDSSPPLSDLVQYDPGQSYPRQYDPVQNDPAQSDPAVVILNRQEKNFMMGQLETYKDQIFCLTSDIKSLRMQVKLHKEVQSELEEENLGQSGLMPREQRAREERRALLKKLLEMEGDAEAALKDVLLLKEEVPKMFQDSRATPSSCSAGLDNQSQVFQTNMKKYETTNRALRKVLRDQHNTQVDDQKLLEEKRALVAQVESSEIRTMYLRIKLEEKVREVEALRRCLDTDKDTKESSDSLVKSLEETRASLEAQLRRKQADNNRLYVKLEKLKLKTLQQQADMERMMEEMMKEKEQALDKTELVKQQARAQKRRLERNEDLVVQLNQRMLGMDNQLGESLRSTAVWQGRHNEMEMEKRRLESEVAVLKRHVTGLKEQMEQVSNIADAEKALLMKHLQEMSDESTAAKLENQTLKERTSATEEKLVLCQAQFQQARDLVKHYDRLLFAYHQQGKKTKAEAEEYCARLAEAQRHAEAMRGQLAERGQLVQAEQAEHLAEIEPLQESLRSAQSQLEQGDERMKVNEELNVELQANFDRVQLQSEQQSNEMDALRRTNKDLLEENEKLRQKVHDTEKKLAEAQRQNSQLRLSGITLEKAIQSKTVSLEAKTRECCNLKRQLNEGLQRAQQASESRNRGSQDAKIAELETSLSQTRAEIMAHEHSKREVERIYQLQIQNLKEQIEDAEKKITSLQEYIRHLKNSNTQVFGDGDGRGHSS